MLPKDESKILKREEPKNHWIKERLNLGVKVSDINGAFINADAMIPENPLYEMAKPAKEVDEDGKRGKVKFNFQNRNSEAIKEQIMPMVLFTLDLEDDFTKKAEREKLRFEIQNLEIKLDNEGLSDEDKEKLAKHKEDYAEKSDKIYTFVHESDFIEAIHENIETIKANRIRVSGTYSINAYNEKYYPQLKPSKLELVSSEKDEETGEYKYKSELLMSSLDFYFDKDSLDDQIKNEKKVFINGYLKGTMKDGDEYVEAYYPQTVVIDCTNLDLENDMVSRLVDFTKSVFKVKKTLHHMAVKCTLKQGAEEVEFDESQLTEFQKMQIALGRKTINDYKPKGAIYGNTITEIRFLDFLDTIKGFEEGAVDTGLKEDEWTIATSKPKEQSLEEAKKEISSGKEKSALEGLFK